MLGGADGAVRLTPALELNPTLHHALVADGWEGTVAKRTTGRLPLRQTQQRVGRAQVARRARPRRRRFLLSLAA
jgi:hypothetical protein